MSRLRSHTGVAIFWLGWPLWRYLLGRSERGRVFITNGDHVLVVKNWLGDNKWSLPGGGIKPGEQPAVGAVRELKEELGITVQPTDLHLLWEGQHHDNGLRYKQHLFSATLANKVVRIDKKELLTATWLTRQELANQRLKPELEHALRLTETNLL